MVGFFQSEFSFLLKGSEFIPVIHPHVTESQNNLLQYCSMEAACLKGQFQNLLRNNRNRIVKRVSWPCQRKSPCKRFHWWQDFLYRGFVWNKQAVTYRKQASLRGQRSWKCNQVSSQRNNSACPESSRNSWTYFILRKSSLQPLNTHMNLWNVWYNILIIYLICIWLQLMQSLVLNPPFIYNKYVLVNWLLSPV